MQKITPFLWFDGKAEEAMLYYTSVFKRSAKGEIRRMPDGRVLSASWTLEGQEFIGLNGGPMYQFTPATSWFVNCEDQAEVDDLWEKLLAGGGKPSRCGWLTDIGMAKCPRCWARWWPSWPARSRCWDGAKASRG